MNTYETSDLEVAACIYAQVYFIDRQRPSIAEVERHTTPNGKTVSTVAFYEMEPGYCESIKRKYDDFELEMDAHTLLDARRAILKLMRPRTDY